MAVSSIGTTVGTSGGTYGLSGSGIDVDSIVKKLMTGEQAKQDALVQKQTVLQWQKDAYNTVYDDISAFRDNLLNFTLQKTLTPNLASSSNESVATVTANADAVSINHSLSVTQLADGVKMTSSGAITLGNASKDSIARQLFSDPSAAPDTIQVKISDGSNSATIDVKTSGTLNDFVSQINKAGIDVKANYDSTLDRFFLYSTNTGSAAQINFDGSNPDGQDLMINKLKMPNITNHGQDAQFDLDGISLTQSSNTFTISGVTYNLKGVSATDSSNKPVPSTISVTDDVDTAVSSIKSLVDSYNKILDEVNGKLSETRYTDYPPLTNAQKTEMKDSDITLWNQKAQSGMLHHDTNLTSLVNSMRNAFSNFVSGIDSVKVSGTDVAYNSASSIGITTGEYSEGGKLHLDTDKLKTALQNNPDVLYSLFGAVGTKTADGKTDVQSQGIAVRLRDALQNSMDQLKTIAGTKASTSYDTTSHLARELKDVNTLVTVEKDRFDIMQSQYYKQYNALEVTLKSLNDQSSWFLSQLGSTSG